MNSDRKMYKFNNNLEQLYKQVTGENIVSQDLPKYVCWECGHYMSKYVAFKSKAIGSLGILTDILNKEGEVTEENCSPFKLESSLMSTDVFTDISICEEERDIVLVIKSENDLIDNDNIMNAMDDIDDEDFMNDNSCGNDILIADYRTQLPLNNITTSNEDSIEDNKKSPKNLRKKDVCPVVKGTGEKKNSTTKINSKTVGAVRANTKKYTRKNKKGKKMKSVRDELDEDITDVTELTFEEQIDAIQQRKESDNYRHSPYKCGSCFKGFLDKDTLERHMIKHSDANGDFECSLCMTRFNRSSRLSQHMKNHMYKFSCRQCNFRAGSLEIAKKHESYHKGKRYTCPHCNDTFTYRNSLLGHIRIKHPSDVVCQHCGLSFLNVFGLNQHVKWVHRSEETTIPEDGPRCMRCDVTFSTQAALDNHVRVSAKHADERQGSPVRNVMKKRKNHPRKACTSEPYPDGPWHCEQCDEKLATPMAYYRHFRQAHRDKNRTVFYNKKKGERHMCEVCGRLFKNKCFLRHHKFLHSETKEFKCERCGKRFQLAANLWYHQKNHCGTRVDYPCSVCGKTFANKSNRYRHMVVHKNHTYKCEICDKAFKCPGNKKNHVDYVHMKKPLPKRNRRSRRRPDEQPEPML